MKYFLLLTILLTPFIIRADDARFNKLFTSANGKFELRLNLENRDWSLIEKATDKEIYKLEGNIWSMTVLVSDDGESVISIDDYSEQNLEENPEVIFFYNNGNKVKTYRLNEVFDNKNFIVESVSHFKWLFGNKNTFAINDSKVYLTTFEMNNLVFDLRTGKLLSKEKDKILADGAIYVYGQVKGLGREKHEIKIECVISGSVKKGSNILFGSIKYKWDGSGFNESLIIKDGELIARKGIIFNRCN